LAQAQLGSNMGEETEPTYASMEASGGLKAITPTEEVIRKVSGAALTFYTAWCLISHSLSIVKAFTLSWASAYLILSGLRSE